MIALFSARRIDYCGTGHSPREWSESPYHFVFSLPNQTIKFILDGSLLFRPGSAEDKIFSSGLPFFANSQVTTVELITCQHSHGPRSQQFQDECQGRIQRM